MKSGKLVLALLTCATSSVFAQVSSPQCEVTNFDQARGIFTVINPAPGALNQQCFVTIHPAGSAAGRFTEGSYEILLSGGGGGGGGGSAGRDSKSGHDGQGGGSALPSRTVRYLSPGVYRLTMGTGGQGGAAGWSSAGGNAGNGNPTGVAEAHSGQTIAGFPGAEMWAGYSRESYLVATTGGLAGMAGPSVNDGNGAHGSRRDAGHPGSGGGHGFIKLTQLTQAQAVTPAPAAIIQQAPAPVLLPAKKDRN